MKSFKIFDFTVELKLKILFHSSGSWKYEADGHTVLIPDRLATGRDPVFEASLPPEIRERRMWSKRDLFCLLHELGHAANRHDPESGDLVDAECQAWQYAADCLQSAYHAELWIYANRCIATYVSA